MTLHVYETCAEARYVRKNITSIVVPVAETEETNERVALCSLAPRAAEPQNSKVQRQYVHNSGLVVSMMFHSDSQQSPPRHTAGKMQRAVDVDNVRSRALMMTLLERPERPLTFNASANSGRISFCRCIFLP